MSNESIPDLDLISSYVGLLSLATFSIYAGSHGSLKVRMKGLKLSHLQEFVILQKLLQESKEGKEKKEKDSDDSDDEDEEEEDIPDRLSAEDAYLFPIVCWRRHRKCIEF